MIPKIARWTVLTALFALPFLALYTSSSMYFPFITGKNFLFRILIELATAAWIVLAISDRKYRPRFSWALVAFALLVVWMAVADSFAVNPHKAFWSNYERMDGWVEFVHVFFLFLVAGAMLEADKLWRRWWLTFIGATTLVTGYGLLQLLGLEPLLQSSTRIESTLGNAEYLAGLLLFAIGITVWQALVTPRKQAWLRYTLYVIVALDLVILFKTGTRGSFVGLAAALVVGGALWLVSSARGEGGQARRAAMIFAAVVAILAIGFFGLRHASFVQKDPNLARIANISVKELGTRVVIWHMAVEGAKERPLTGWGQEGYNYVFNKYYDPSLYAQEPWFDRAHSVYLDYLVAGGIPALLLFLALFIGACVSVYRTRERDAAGRIIVLAILAGYAVQGIVVFDNLFTYIPLALVLAYAHSLRARPIALFENAPQIRGGTLDAMIAPVAFAVALALVYFVNVPSMLAASDLIDGLTPSAPVDVRLNYFKTALGRGPFATQEIREQLLSFAEQVVGAQNVPDDVKLQVAQYASAQLEAELARAPQDARLYIQYATFLRNIGQYDAARKVSAKARALSPKKQSIIIEQGIEAWQGGDAPAALAYFREDYDLAPSNPDAAIYGAIGLILNNQIPAAKDFLIKGFGTSTIDNLPLALAYQQAKDVDDMIAVLRVHAQDGQATSGYQLAIALAQAGRMAEARAQVQAVIAAHPETSTQGASLLAQMHGK